MLWRVWQRFCTLIKRDALEQARSIIPGSALNIPVLNTTGGTQTSCGFIVMTHRCRSIILFTHFQLLGAQMTDLYMTDMVSFVYLTTANNLYYLFIHSFVCFYYNVSEQYVTYYDTENDNWWHSWFMIGLSTFLYLPFTFYDANLVHSFTISRSYHIMDIKMFGRRSHQYQFPALENTAISRPTSIPL